MQGFAGLFLSPGQVKLHDAIDIAFVHISHDIRDCVHCSLRLFYVCTTLDHVEQKENKKMQHIFLWPL